MYVCLARIEELSTILLKMEKWDMKKHGYVMSLCYRL